MIFSLFALLIEKNILTYGGQTLFLTQVNSFKKNKTIYQQSFQEIDSDPKDFFLKRFIERDYLKAFQINFNDQVFEEQIHYRAQSLKMTPQNFIQAINQSGLSLKEFRDLLEYQFYHQNFVQSFSNKIDAKNVKGSEETYYVFSRFEVNQDEEKDKTKFKLKVEQLVKNGQFVDYKTFTAAKTPYPIDESSLEDSMRNVLKTLKNQEISQVFSVGNKWIVVHLQSQQRKKLSQEETMRKNLMKKTYDLAKNYLDQEVQSFKLHEKY